MPKHLLRVHSTFARLSVYQHSLFLYPPQGKNKTHPHPPPAPNTKLLMLESQALAVLRAFALRSQALELLLDGSASAHLLSFFF